MEVNQNASSSDRLEPGTSVWLKNIKQSRTTKQMQEDLIRIFHEAFPFLGKFLEISQQYAVQIQREYPLCSTTVKVYQAFENTRSYILDIICRMIAMTKSPQCKRFELALKDMNQIREEMENHFGFDLFKNTTSAPKLKLHIPEQSGKFVVEEVASPTCPDEGIDDWRG